MADRFPLIVDSSAEQLQELAVGDNLNLASSGLINADNIQTSGLSVGVMTATSFSGDGSQLTNLPAAGSSTELTASGTLADGSKVIVNADGTVSAVAQVGSGWIASLGGSGTEYGHGVTHDSSGNVYIAGYTGSSGQGSNDILVAKYNSSGTIQWQRTLGAGGNDKGVGVALDSSNNVYVAGLINNQSTGRYEGLIVKYNNSGAIQWQRMLGISNAHSFFNGVGIDSSDNVYVSGRTAGGGGQGSNDFLIAKYNSSGAIQWQRVLGSSTQEVDQENAIAVDGSGNVYIGGYTNVNVTGNSQMLLAKYNSSGTLQWQVYQGAVGFKGIEGIALDDSGNVYVVGESQENPSWSYYSLFVVKYNSSGSFQWQRRLHDDSANTTQGRGITVDSSGNVYVGGYSNKGAGAIIAKYNSSGTIQWQRYLTRSSTGVSEAYDLSVDNSDNLYVTGYSNIVSAGGWDAFIAKLPTDGSGTGTHGSYSYIQGTLTETATSHSGEGSASLTSATSSLTASTSTMTAATSSLTSSITSMASTNLTSENYIGISDGAYTNGQTATVQLIGSVDDAQSSLTPGQKYYVQNDGTLSTTADSPSVLAGTAIASTKLLIKK